MAIGEFTKQLAQQALTNAGKSILDTPGPAPSVEPGSPEGIGATILAEVKAMQSALKDDAELAVFVGTGGETLRISEVYLPSPFVAVLIGTGADRNITRVITRIDALQLTCKVLKVPAGAKPLRVAFREAKAK